MFLISGMTVTCEWTSVKLLMLIRLEKIKLDKKQYGLDQSTDRQTVYKWRKFNTTLGLPRSVQTTQITARARHVIL